MISLHENSKSLEHLRRNGPSGLQSSGESYYAVLMRSNCEGHFFSRPAGDCLMHVSRTVVVIVFSFFILDGLMRFLLIACARVTCIWDVLWTVIIKTETFS